MGWYGLVYGLVWVRLHVVVGWYGLVCCEPLFVEYSAACVRLVHNKKNGANLHVVGSDPNDLLKSRALIRRKLEEPGVPSY